MKYIVIFSTQAEDDPDYNSKTVKDYGFKVEADDAEDAFVKWEIPNDYTNQWLLVGVIREVDLAEWKLKNDGIPLLIRTS